ncbi:SLATT domain-containing protein [Pseudomonas sp. BGI-2]|uniref:SLATT domain-containing protein n=1 Tax=Pseudomonas sp. BGI-2 TaxID=2528211 RepID=UPI00103525A1|nr:SLATT domain-containing protein [Pseudomonas sp. BGI-2]TBN47396.1 DUF4231 domain-containing protein [Pseudomonas sp. BGI-2]
MLPDNTEHDDKLPDPEVFTKNLIQGFKSKAVHNKNESMFFFWLSMGGALTAPLFLTLGSGMFLEKVVPSMLSALVAFSTTWLQLRKPQQLWALYRTSQREIEDNLHKFQYKILDYKDSAHPEKLLIERVSKIALDAHYSWLPMVPNPENIQGSSKQRTQES